MVRGGLVRAFGSGARIRRTDGAFGSGSTVWLGAAGFDATDGPWGGRLFLYEKKTMGDTSMVFRLLMLCI